MGNRPLCPPIIFAPAKNHVYDILLKWKIHQQKAIIYTYLIVFLGHSLAGGVFCLLGGQPLTVLGCTGPVLIFEKILVDFCELQDLDYMTMVVFSWNS